MWRYLELIGILTAMVAPFYFLADKVSGDELVKTGVGTALAALVYAIPKVYGHWSKHRRGDD